MRPPQMPRRIVRAPMASIDRVAAALLVIAGCATAPTIPPGPPTRPAVAPAAPVTVAVTLVAAEGVVGTQRINVAVPLAPGLLRDPAHVRVLVGGRELPAARRGLATWGDGSLRSVQLQVDVDPAASLTVSIGPQRGAAGPALVPVADTLVPGDETPRVWALLPAAWLATSGVAGPLVPTTAVVGTPLEAWSQKCDAARWGTDVFLTGRGEKQGWLYDRVTAFYRLYAIGGEPAPLRAAYREAAIYRSGVPVASGVAQSIPVPTAADDVKYHYAQGLALHYLLTGDDRYREAAEAVAARVATLWPDPRHDGVKGFWTERQAGFALLAYEWAALVSDDRSAELAALADAVVDASLAIQARAPGSAGAGRCFAHTAEAHSEPFGYLGCSPWMSAILADGLVAHAARVGGARAARVRASLVELGRSVAREGLDPTGKPFYWMGTGNGRGEIDPYEEHWGEAAYLVAMAWHEDGRRDTGLRAAADALVAGFAAKGEIAHIRSFNWQCRSAPMTPAYLGPRP
jgi:hypothetical protein